MSEYTCAFDPDKPPAPYPLAEEIIAYETGEMDGDEDRYFALFQHLVDTGLAWSLQGHYGRTARDLIAAGLVTAR